MSMVLNGRGVSARFDSGKVRVERSGQQVEIPFRAVREVRTVGERVLEIELADGSAHRVEGGNPTATAAFAGALTAVLPRERDPEGAAVVTEAEPTRDWFLYASMAGLGALALGYVGYVVWVALNHGSRVLGVLLGLLPLLAGIIMPLTGISEVVRRIVLSRRGITVLAEAVGKDGKKTVYVYTDAEGETHRYTCKRSLQRIQLAYDPGGRVGAAHADWLPFVVGRVLVLIVGGLFWLFVGGAMVFGVLT
ncbi:hypothetical protein ABZ896_01330 [Streptomyces sp. NPDC047072]|uniref:hypothetical protein n=1 Tax=Streptomyces sp. NPDC047072 TaxID=3154809 RepID=UPI0033C48D8C